MKSRVSLRVAASVILAGAAAVAAVQPAQAFTYTGTPALAAATCSPKLQGLFLSPASVPGGAPSIVTVTLTCAAPKAETIALSGFPGTRVPQKLRVPAGKNKASGRVTTLTRRSVRSGWITGKFGGRSRRARLRVSVTPKTCKSPALSAVSLPGLAYVGDRVVLSVKLTCPSASAVRLSLASADAPASAPLIQPRATATIGAYYRTASIVLVPKAYLPGQYKSTVSVRHGTKTLSRTITVDPGLSEFANNGDSCSPDAVNLSIFFTGEVPAGGLTVKLRSDNAAITVPATAAFTQQGSIGGGFLGVSVKSVSKDTKVTLSATLGSRTLTVSIVLLRAWRSGDKITLTPSSGSAPYYGPSYGYEVYIELSNPAPASGMTGTATTDHPSDVQDLDSQVLVSPGCDNAIVSFDVPYESQPVHATVTVSLGGSMASTSLTIEPSLASVTIPATIVGGQSSTGTVTLAGATDAPDTVYLESTWGILTVPVVVTIPAGQTSVTFPITTVPVTSDSQVTVIASHSVGSQVADSVTSNQTDITP